MDKTEGSFQGEKTHGMELAANIKHPRICVDVDVIGRVPELVYGILRLASGTGCTNVQNI